MTAELERSPERDAAIRAMLPYVAGEGWTLATLRHAMAESGGDPLDAAMLFTRAADIIEAWADLADRDMVAGAVGIADLRLSQRVRALVALRLRQSRDHREAVRRALAVLATPGHAAMAARITARTVDAIWHAAGDRSADFSWYSKRAILAAIYSATLLFWLRDVSDEDADTLAFLDRRLAGLGRITRLRKRLIAWMPSRAQAA